ncbi:methyltransferase, FxLD system [Streptacidiphilus albus]|uniref:methyltransferase, FxLD system n=1 Tax=Streptacidiphilus albus TaxID=105425 RepID=UPI00054B2A65|nr:methyltransferase, FxLD system [Streptacidiphilus albus]
MNATTSSDTAEALRNRMVDQIKDAGGIQSSAVEDAMRTVHRDAFLPAATLEEAYADQAVTIKPNPAGGLALSCASQPTIVALMLDQLDVKPGDRILEIGAGTGYNAALLTHLAGPDGQVTTVDIDSDVTTHARKALDATGNEHVHVATRDGALGDPDHAPYDKAIVAVGAWDIPAAWWDQLPPGSRLVVPLRWRGTTRSIAFTRETDRMVSSDVQLCGFVPMLGQDGERDATITADGTVNLYWDIDQPIDPADLHGVLDQPKAEAWSGTTVGGYEPFDGVWLRLSATEAGTCRIEALPAAVESGLCKPAIPSRSPALAEGNSLAYFVTRRQESEEGSPAQFELGAVGHGPAGGDLAERLCEQIRAWGRTRTARPTITVYPAGTPGDQLAIGYAIDKHDSRMVISLT